MDPSSVFVSVFQQWKDCLQNEVDWLLRQGMALEHLPQERVIIALSLTLVKGVCIQAPRLIRCLFNTVHQFVCSAGARWLTEQQQNSEEIAAGNRLVDHSNEISENLLLRTSQLWQKLQQCNSRQEIISDWNKLLSWWSCCENRELKIETWIFVILHTFTIIPPPFDELHLSPMIDLHDRFVLYSDFGTYNPVFTF